MTRYVKRGSYETLEEYVRSKTGKTIQELNQIPHDYKLDLIPKIAEEIKKAMQEKRKIYVHADYDVDGITFASQIALLFNYLQYPCEIKIPKRFTDGYGIKAKHVEKMEPGSLLILGDNGISALEAIEVARAKNIYVIVMDHHTGDRTENGSLIRPNANLLLDPTAIPEGNDFHSYCGAGLAYKLVQYMVSDTDVLMTAATFAAMGTVADVVSLSEDNRKIVNQGLYAINHGMTTVGLNTLVQELGLTGHVTADDISFYLAPLLNAPGRLYDEGATWSAMTLLSKDPAKSTEMVARLKEINEERKQLVEDLLEQIKVDPTKRINVIRLPDLSPEGCIGILAGKITEQTGKPSFLYSLTKEGILKGSARSDDETKNHVHKMLLGIKDHLLGFGGHPGAAGFSFSIDEEESVREHLLSCEIIPHDNTPYFDLTIKPEQLTAILNQMELCEPFGKNLEMPVFRMPCHFTGNEWWKSMGKEGDHICFTLPGQSKPRAVAFRMKEQYLKDGAPKNIYLYGRPNFNWYNGNCYPQFLVEDYEKK